MIEIYSSFEELRLAESEGRDYQIHFRKGNSGIAVMAPHGGGIEPGTTEIANKVAGEKHSFYSFEGWKRKGNLTLHITSRRFDEPSGLHIAKVSETILTIHGCKGREKVVYLGGKDEALMEKVRLTLGESLFSVVEHPRFPGTSPNNICNRNRRRKGVQLEISAGLRCIMFQNLTRPERKKTTEVFELFVRALKRALSRP